MQRRLNVWLVCFFVACGCMLAGCDDEGTQGSQGTSAADTSSTAQDSSGINTTPDATQTDDDAPPGPDASDSAEDTADAGDSSGAQPPKVGCQPVASEYDCMLPYPSDFFLTADASMPSGRRVVVPPDALPRYKSGEIFDPLSVFPADGFSHHPPIMAFWPQRIDTANLTFHGADVSASLQPGNTTLLINADTGEPVLHFAELDMRDSVRDQRRVLLVRPMVKLENSARYIVAIQGVKDADTGALLEAPEGFRMLRDKTPVDAGHPDAEALSTLSADYEAVIFPKLEAFGVERDSLQLAWAFTVESEANVLDDILSMRADAMAIMQAQPPAVTVTEMLSGSQLPASLQSRFIRRVYGTIEVPLYLTANEPGAPLNRDAQGQVQRAGTTLATFTALVPHSAVSLMEGGEGPVRLLQFGHGFFGTCEEIEQDNNIQKIAADLGVVLFCTDEVGFSTPDMVWIVNSITTDPTNLYNFTDRVLQGYIHQIAVGYAAQGPLGALDALRVDGEPLIDGSEVYLYGRSNGHIQGAVYMALSPHISRGVLNVGGASLTFMMSRASPFAPLLSLFNIKLSDPVDIQKVIALSPTVLDRVDPISYATHLLTDTFEGSPAERFVLQQAGIGDTSVPNLASHLHARAMKIPHLQPSPRDLPGLEKVDISVTPHDGSGFIEIDFGVAEPLPGELSQAPSQDNSVHGAVSDHALLRVQVDQFLRLGGVIAHPCEGPCDPD
jgi:hypothetical protein